MMPMYENRDPVIRAIRLDDTDGPVKALNDAGVDATIRPSMANPSRFVVEVQTYAGPVMASPGDWVAILDGLPVVLSDGQMHAMCNLPVEP